MIICVSGTASIVNRMKSGNTEWYVEMTLQVETNIT